MQMNVLVMEASTGRLFHVEQLEFILPETIKQWFIDGKLKLVIDLSPEQVH